MNRVLRRPIAILEEHPEWSSRLIAELEGRRLPYEKVDHSNHAYDPRDRDPRYSVIVNRTSPSSATRGHGGVLFYAEALLNHYASLGVPVINPVQAYRGEKSKALQLDLFERVGARYPRTLVVNHPDKILKALDQIPFPLVVKPNVGGSGAGIVRSDSRAPPPSTSAAWSTWWPSGTGRPTTTTSTPPRTSWPTPRRCSASTRPPASSTTSPGSPRRARPRTPGRPGSRRRRRRRSRA